MFMMVIWNSFINNSLFLLCHVSEPQIQDKVVRVVLNVDQGQTDHSGSAWTNAKTHTIKFQHPS